MKRLLFLAIGCLSGLTTASPLAGVPQPAGELRPYDAADFLLAFDTLVGAGDLASALRVAQHAVQHDPANLDWRIRLARVAEWQGKLELAWEQRKHLYQRGWRDAETIAALLRLGMFYGEPQMMLDLWLAEARRKSLTVAQWEEVRRLFNQSMQLEEGMQFFERQYRHQAEPRFLTWAAEFAEGLGRDDDALRLYLERAKLEPFSLAAVLSAATFLVRKDRLREAHQLLLAHEPRVPENEREYWKKLADIAWELAENESAERAYRRYLAASQDASLMSRLIYLVQQRDVGEAASLYLATYRRHGGIANIIAALQLLGDTTKTPLAAQVLAAIRPEDLPALEADARFLLLRALFHQRRQKLDAAWQDLQRALSLAPEDVDVAVNALWFVIERREVGVLEKLLAHWQARAAQTEALWLPFAAAYHALDRYSEALPWYRREIERQPGDMLLLLNYADLLERLERHGMAMRVRQHAWHQLKKRPPIDPQTLARTGEATLLAQARLFVLDRPGDAAQRLISRIVSQLLALPVEGSSSASASDQVDDLVLAWAIGSEQYANAKHWMWRQYLRGRTKGGREPPVWAQSQVSLQLDDGATLRRLLNERADAMPIYNRYDAAYALEDWRQALDIAFHGMERNPVDEALYDRYRLHAPLHSHYLQLGWRGDRLGDYRAGQLEGRMHLNLSLKLAVDLSWSSQAQSSRQPQLAHLAPGEDRLAGVGVIWRGSRGNTRLTLEQRDELDRFFGMRLEQSLRLGRRLGIDGAVEYRVAATDSLPLRVAGWQSGARLGLNYVLSKRETLQLGLRWSNYATQFGDQLGTGFFYDLGFTHRLRTEYPDWRLRATFSGAHYRYDSGLGTRSLAALGPDIRAAIAAGTQDAVRYFLPEGSQTFGLCFGMGENLAGQDIRLVYSRGWRHHYELCATHNTVTGAGYSADFGVVGSLTGEDHLSLSLGQSAGGSGNTGLNRFLQTGYRHYF